MAYGYYVYFFLDYGRGRLVKIIKKRGDGIAVPGGGGIEEGELLPYFLDIPLATR